MWKRPLVISCTAVLASQAITTPVLNDSKQEKNNSAAWRRPGLYAWGSNAHQVISSDQQVNSVKTPTRIPYFDGRILRDVSLNEQAGIAVLENGDVVQWHDGERTIIKGKDITSVKLSGKTVVAFSYRHCRIFTWSIEAEPKPEEIKLPKFWWFETIKSIEVGQNHILALTSRGRIFSGSVNSPEKSRAQFGLASCSQFDAPPEQGSLRVVKLLEDTPIKRISVGQNHSLALSRKGKLFVFGENTNGQLGIRFSYKTANIGAPTELNIEQDTVTNIAAGGNVTYITTQGSSGRSIYSLGNGMSGQLGTGSFSHSQVNPVKIKKLEELEEYSEKTKRMEPMKIKSWSVGEDHTFVTIQSSSAHQAKDVFAWGWNDKGQLGNGKRATISHPTAMKDENDMPVQLMEKEKLRFMDEQGKMRSLLISQEITAGDKCSGIFYRKS